MGYKKKQAVITCSSNEDDNSGSTSIGMPPNILMKVSWSKHLKFLSNEDRAALFTNIFHYYTGDVLVEMTPIAQMFFATATELFDFNIDKYGDVVIKNRENGKKHVGKTKETQINPVGFSETQNNLKEKERVKEKEKSKDNIKETNNASAMQYKEKFREIVNIDFRTITDMDFKYFCYDVIELVEKLGWARFDVIMFGTALKDLAGVLTDYNLIELEAAAAKTKRSYNFYIDKLIK
jgi:Family of unknown function (DUF6291)